MSAHLDLIVDRFDTQLRRAAEQNAFNVLVECDHLRFVIDALGDKTDELHKITLALRHADLGAIDDAQTTLGRLSKELDTLQEALPTV